MTSSVFVYWRYFRCFFIAFTQGWGWCMCVCGALMWPEAALWLPMTRGKRLWFSEPLARFWFPLWFPSLHTRPHYPLEHTVHHCYVADHLKTNFEKVVLLWFFTTMTTLLVWIVLFAINSFWTLIIIIVIIIMTPQKVGATLKNAHLNLFRVELIILYMHF